MLAAVHWADLTSDHQVMITQRICNVLISFLAGSSEHVGKALLSCSLL